MLILIRRCLSLSKGLKQLIEGDTRIWKTLDLSTTKRALPKKSLLQYLKRSDFTLNKAIIKMFHGGGSAQTIRIIATKCRQLEYLSVATRYYETSVGASLLDNLPMAKNLKTLILSQTCEVSLKMISKMLEACRTLSTAEFHNATYDYKEGSPRWTTELPCLTHLVLKSVAPHTHNFSTLARHSWLRLGLVSLY